MIKLGYLSAILDGFTYEEVIDIAVEEHFKCVELAAWPFGNADRRYAGVSHVDADRVLADEKYRNHLLKYASDRKIEISALGYYPNFLDADEHKRILAVEHIKKLIIVADLMDVPIVTTFIGRNQTKTIAENLELMEQIWPAILTLAEEKGVKIAIENCPMLFGEEQWPGGQNLMSSPAIWREVFRRLPSDYLGINFDPSHFVWQQMDYLKPVYEFKNKIFHVHFKDIKLYKEKLEEMGVMAYPLEYMSPKIPGYGDVNWGKFISALTDIGYNGATCIEIEDKAFEENKDSILYSLRQAKSYMNQYVK